MSSSRCYRQGSFLNGWNISHYFLNLDVFPRFAVGSCAVSSFDWFIWFSACIVIGYLSNFTMVKRKKFSKAKQSTLKLRCYFHCSETNIFPIRCRSTKRFESLLKQILNIWSRCHLSAEFYSEAQCFQQKEAHYLQENEENVKSK